MHRQETMGISAELISVAFGLAGVAIALATYWMTRKRSTIILEPDAELALLDPASHPVSPSPSADEVNTFVTTTPPPMPATQHNIQTHEVMGDVLQLFARYLSRGRT
ncbi:hypothetical protein VTL71DRAFT_4643 [Oculimacula yallundae]|uniref:Uncharacterized protein n=1 Tax=Oculimacula yallundae TaxID=86028 RepID=A0ABR4C2M2_9HELO